MICYQDRTFCSFWQLCKSGHTCDRALTEDVRRRAAKKRLPISQWMEFPECFVREGGDDG